VSTGSTGSTLEDRGWTTRFGVVEAAEVEDWGRVTSLLLRYESGMEVEFGLANLDRATSADDGTRRVVSNGLRVLWDPNGFFESIS